MALSQLGAGFATLVARGLEPFDLPLAGAARERLVVQAATFLDRAVAWNARIDLTSARHPEELVDLLFADAAAIVGSGLVRSTERWVDVGSGIGAPGLSLALLMPGLEVTLVEPRAKRVAFLRTVLASLDPLPVRVVRSRSETLPAASFDVAVSRATLPPDEWLREGVRLARQRVWVLLARGDAPEHGDWEVARDVAFRWPLTGRERRVVAFDFTKKNSAPNKS
jgi:16S rRNA (guanine527-N7)-methyltransferase